jgi:hypothetical protein
MQYMNRTKDKNRMIIFVEAEKAFNKIQHHFIVRVLQKLGIHGSYLQTQYLGEIKEESYLNIVKTM